jgi:predicted acyl esterase
MSTRCVMTTTETALPIYRRLPYPYCRLRTGAAWACTPAENFKGFSGVASQQKWLEAHGLEHWTEFYTDYGIDIQRRFFDHFLKGADNGWDRTPPVQSKYAPRRDSSAATRTIGRSLEHAGPLTISISTLEPCRRLSRQRTGMQYFGRERMC